MAGVAFLYTMNGVYDDILSLPNGNSIEQNKRKEVTTR